MRFSQCQVDEAVESFLGQKEKAVVALFGDVECSVCTCVQRVSSCLRESQSADETHEQGGKPRARDSTWSVDLSRMSEVEDEERRVVVMSPAAVRARKLGVEVVYCRRRSCGEPSALLEAAEVFEIQAGDAWNGC